MSVLHLLGSDGEGGAETYFVDLVSALQQAGPEQACALRHHAGREAALAQARRRHYDALTATLSPTEDA